MAGRWRRNTPFRLYKINAHRGGHSVPFVVSWPDGRVPAGELRQQFVHVTDLLPTVLGIAGVERPDRWRGEPVLPLAGEDVVATLHSADGSRARTLDVVIENEGHRGYRRGGLRGGDPARAAHLVQRASTGSCSTWRRIPTQVHDLAEEHPELAGRAACRRGTTAAWDNQIFPLDEGTGYRFLLRPPWTERYDRPVVLRPGTPQLDRWRSQRLILWRDVTITASVTLAAGDAGVLVAHGDQGGGYSLYVDDTGELVAAHNGYGIEREVRGPVVAAR